ncbi:MAG: DUF115 domain-containing protein, partial [Pseudomonadales bacterium]|nr:DUF115 domain-containing protein [Pseudomonadales bacterium]
MSNNSANPLQDFIELRAKNLNFFRSYYPGIYEFFSTYQLKGSKLDILPETNEVDLIVDGGSLYSKRAKQYAKREMAAFLNAYDYGTKVKSVRPLAKDTYTNQRLFARSISGLYEQYYEKFQGSVPFGGYQLPDFFPLVVFMGCGLGLHIQYLASIRDIRHCLILETDMDRFAGSFYCVDWEQTLMPFLSDPARSCKFILLPDLQDEQLIYGAVWNELIRMCPIFPLTTLFYNHLSNPVFDRVSDRINRDIYVHLFSFGNFDDEINQLNNTLHNFRRGVSLIGKPDQNHLDLPVCIVGSGPSLESRQAELKSIQNKVLIISCGTALGALLKLGIVPDIQVELESDYVTYTLHAQLEHVEKLKDVRLLGAAQLNPLLFELFGTAKVFFKSDGALAYWFEKQEQAIPNATPTCTNAALAICLHFGFKNILLFG